MKEKAKKVIEMRNCNKAKIKKSKERGITLIALIVTIIVLLILAGITIATLTGENGIITKAIEAREQTIIAEEKEKISLAYTACKTNDFSSNVTDEQLQEELGKLDDNVQVTTSGDDLIVLFNKTMHKYSVNQDGEIQQIANLDPEEKDKIVDMLDINVAVTEGGEVLYINTNIDTSKYSILDTENTTTITENGVKKAIDGVCFIDGEGKLYMCGGIDSVDIPICISDMDNDLKGKNIVDVYYHRNYSIMVARDSEGKLYTWGSNEYGQLGDGTTEIGYSNYRDEPICISDLDNDLKGKNIVDVYASSTVIAKDSEGKLYTWGRNQDGELGDGTTENRKVPICISDLENDLNGKSIVDLYNGSAIIARDSEGKLYTWGSNMDGKLGDGTTENRKVPICISDLENDLKGKNIVDVYTGPTMIAKDSEGKLYTWGRNQDGELGDGTTEIGYSEYRNVPMCISDLENDLKGKNIVDVYTGSTMIAKDSEGKLYTWGSNVDGKLGDGTTVEGENRDVPICISDLENDLKGKNIVDIYDDGSTIIAKDSEGKLYTWGSNKVGELGDGSTETGYDNYRDVPICISDLENDIKGKNMVDIVNIEGGMFAKDNEGKLYTWGYNGFGQLGDRTTEVIEVPICISDNKNSIFFNTEISNYTMIDYAMTSHMLVSDDGKVIYVAWNNAAPN